MVTIVCSRCGGEASVKRRPAKFCSGCRADVRREVKARSAKKNIEVGRAAQKRWRAENPEKVREADRRRWAKPERRAYHREFVREQYWRKRAVQVAPLWAAAAAEVSRAWIALPPAPEVLALPEHASVACVGGPSSALVCSVPREFVAGYCVEQGEAFVSPYGGDRFCSPACRKRNARRKDRVKRRSRQRDGERIDLVVVAKRDGWRCHICKRKVSRKTWSLDHLVPLSDGGVHRYENVALAHHLCNSRRGARGAAQLRLAA